MTKYGEFIEAYKKAFPLVRKKLQYEQANKIWSALKKLKPDEFEQQFKEKMSEFKLLTAGNCLKNMKTFTQSRLSFGKAKIPVVSCCEGDQTCEASTSQQKTNELVSEKSATVESSASNSGRFIEQFIYFN